MIFALWNLKQLVAIKQLWLEQSKTYTLYPTKRSLLLFQDGTILRIVIIIIFNQATPEQKASFNRTIIVCVTKCGWSKWAGVWGVCLQSSWLACLHLQSFPTSSQKSNTNGAWTQSPDQAFSWLDLPHLHHPIVLLQSKHSFSPSPLLKIVLFFEICTICTVAQ